MKRHGPDLNPKPEPVIQCEGCNGAGRVKGIFYSMACVRCNGAGFLLEENGAALPAEEQVVYLRTWLKRSQTRCKQQDELIKALEPFRKAKARADLIESIYPEQYKRNRRGGHGD